jgi:phage gpG-like protein
MAGLNIRFDTTEVDRVIRTLEKLGQDSTPLMRVIGRLMVQEARKRLGGETAPDGSLWPELLPAYAQMRALMYPAATGMLKLRGTLSRSLTYEAGPHSVRAGSPLIYAGVHQAGATILPVRAQALVFPLMGASGHVFLEHRKSVTIPARPYLGIGDPERLGIERATIGMLRRAFEG